MKIDIRFGQPTPYNYETIIDHFSGTSYSTFRTSSIPLVQFWKDTETRLGKLFKVLNLDPRHTTLCFEYPTPPQKGKGKSSMTDLMVFAEDIKVAIEAKFTEYTPNGSIKLIKHWGKKGNTENKKLVLQYWKDLIGPFSYGMDDEALLNVEYQFFHRTASACKDIKQAIVVYLVFYDEETKKHLGSFIKKLKNYITVINPKDNLKFYLWQVEVSQKVAKKKDTDNPFLIMKKREVYRIGSSNLGKISTN
jgi:hypothetical protein